MWLDYSTLLFCLNLFQRLFFIGYGNSFEKNHTDCLRHYLRTEEMEKGWQNKDYKSQSCDIRVFVLSATFIITVTIEIELKENSRRGRNFFRWNRNNFTLRKVSKENFVSNENRKFQKQKFTRKCFIQKSRLSWIKKV